MDYPVSLRLFLPLCPRRNREEQQESISFVVWCLFVFLRQHKPLNNISTVSRLNLPHLWWAIRKDAQDWYKLNIQLCPPVNNMNQWDMDIHIFTSISYCTQIGRIFVYNGQPLLIKKEKKEIFPCYGQAGHKARTKVYLQLGLLLAPYAF